MSDSHKARFGMGCRHWKDSVLSSRSQKRAWSKRKRIRSQQERAEAKRRMLIHLQEGIDDARVGRVHSRGSFATYADE